MAALTEKQKQALGCIERGLTRAQAAKDMGVSPNTAKERIALVLRKLGYRTQRELREARMRRRESVTERQRAVLAAADRYRAEAQGAGPQEFLRLLDALEQAALMKD